MRNFAILLILSLALPLCACNPTLSTSPGAIQTSLGASIAQTVSTPRTISVSGNAEVMVVPDEVVLTLGVETLDLQLTAAKSTNDAIVQRVLAIAQDMQIDPKLVQTDYMNIEPSYDSSYNKRNFLGYYVRKNIVITQKDVTRFEELLSRALEAGVNYVHNIDFRTTELRKYRDQARALALQAAQEKATAMGKQLGQSIGQPLKILENYNTWWYPWSSWWGGSYASQTAQNVVQNAGGENPIESDTGISLGQIAVSASVTVDFELK
jgi:uncharacterized protein YggE